MTGHGWFRNATVALVLATAALGPANVAAAPSIAQQIAAANPENGELKTVIAALVEHNPGSINQILAAVTAVAENVEASTTLTPDQKAALATAVAQEAGQGLKAGTEALAAAGNSQAAAAVQNVVATLAPSTVMASYSGGSGGTTPTGGSSGGTTTASADTNATTSSTSTGGISAVTSPVRP